MKTEQTTIFDYLNNIIKTKDHDLLRAHVVNDMFEKTYSVYMMNRYLSMHTSPHIANIIVTHQKALEVLSPSAHYHFLMRMIPKTYQSFITYIK
jgi:hypothetical protein